MQLFYTRENGQVIEFTYKIPREQWFHWSRKFKKSDIQLITKLDRSEAATVRGEIVNAINQDPVPAASAAPRRVGITGVTKP